MALMAVALIAPSASARVVALTPDADTYIEVGSESAYDHGECASFDVDVSPWSVAFLRFDLTEIPGRVLNATLTLRCRRGSNDGGRIYPVPSSGWIEGDRCGPGGLGLKWGDVDCNRDERITAADRVCSSFVPDFSHRIAALGRVRAGGSYTPDVTTAFQRGPQLYTLAVANDSRDGATYRSREDSMVSRRPALQLEIEDAPPEPPGSTTTTMHATPTTTTSTTMTSTTQVSRCLQGDSPVIIVSGINTSRLTFGDSELVTDLTIDARTATFVAGPGNLLPLKFDRGSQYFLMPERQEPPGVCLSGGSITGVFSRNETWAQSKAHAGAGAQFWPRMFSVESMRVDNIHDGFRPIDGNDWTVRGVHMSYIRDDCIENDHMRSGFIEDSLFDGCYVFVSARPSSAILNEGWDGTNELVEVDRALVRMQAMPGPDCLGSNGWGTTWKWHSGNPGKSPKLTIRNSIFRYDQLGCSGSGSVQLPPGKLENCDNNVVVWTGAGNFPSGLPACFTVTRDTSIWDDAVTDWLVRHSGASTPRAATARPPRDPVDRENRSKYKAFLATRP